MLSSLSRLLLPSVKGSVTIPMTTQQLNCPNTATRFFFRRSGPSRRPRPRRMRAPGAAPKSASRTGLQAYLLLAPFERFLLLCTEYLRNDGAVCLIIMSISPTELVSGLAQIRVFCFRSISPKLYSRVWRERRIDDYSTNPHNGSSRGHPANGIVPGQLQRTASFFRFFQIATRNTEQ